MSSNFEFFGAAPGAAAPTAAPAPVPAAQQFGVPAQQFGVAALDRFGLPAGIGLPVAAPIAQAPARSYRRPLVAAAVAVVVACGGVLYYLSQQQHPIALPSTLAGLSQVSLKAAGAAHEFDAAKKQLAKAGVHDASFGVYGDVQTGRALIVVAGRASPSAVDMVQLVSDSGVAAQVDGVTITPAVLTSGGTSFRCETVSTVSQGSAGVCEWVGSGVILFGVGTQLLVQETADALEQARIAASLG